MKALMTAKMMYVWYPMLLNAIGVMTTMLG